MTPAAIVRELRGELSQAEFGALLGVSASLICEAEQGRISVNLAVKLAAFSGRPVGDFLKGE